MPNSNARKARRVIDKFVDAAVPRVDQSNVSERSGWWWILIMPGKVILWLEYMFPERIVSVFGTARRRNVPLMQILYSLYFYFAVLGLGLLYWTQTRAH